MFCLGYGVKEGISDFAYGKGATSVLPLQVCTHARDSPGILPSVCCYSPGHRASCSPCCHFGRSCSSCPLCQASREPCSQPHKANLQPMNWRIQQFIWLKGCPTGQNNQLHLLEVSSVTPSSIGSASLHSFPHPSLELWMTAHNFTTSGSALWRTQALTLGIRRVLKPWPLRVWFWSRLSLWSGGDQDSS